MTEATIRAAFNEKMSNGTEDRILLFQEGTVCIRVLEDVDEVHSLYDVIFQPILVIEKLQADHWVAVKKTTSVEETIAVLCACFNSTKNRNEV